MNASNVSKELLNEEEIDDPLNADRSSANETCLQSVIPDFPLITENDNANNPTGTEIYNIAPGENKHPVSIMTDKLCEELAFPVLFPKGRYGFSAEQDIKLSPQLNTLMPDCYITVDGMQQTLNIFSLHSL